MHQSSLRCRSASSYSVSPPFIVVFLTTLGRTVPFAFVIFIGLLALASSMINVSEAIRDARSGSGERGPISSTNRRDREAVPLWKDKIVGRGGPLLRTYTYRERPGPRRRLNCSRRITDKPWFGNVSRGSFMRFHRYWQFQCLVEVTRLGGFGFAIFRGGHPYAQQDQTPHERRPNERTRSSGRRGR